MQQQLAMAATPCLKDFFEDEKLNAIETEKRIEPVQQPKSFFDEEILNAIETEKRMNQCNNRSQ